MRRVIMRLLGVAAGLVVLGIVIVVVLTQTELGHERVRRLAEGRLNRAPDRVVRIGRLSGNLLVGVTLTNISITDRAGRPFFRSDTVVVRYNLPSLLQQRIDISSARLVAPAAWLDRRPRGGWNFERILSGVRGSGDARVGRAARRGLGHWVVLRDVSVRGGRVLVRTPWEPDARLAPAARDSAVAALQAGDGRARLERVAGGWQRVMEFREADATLPRLRIVHPDSTGTSIKIGALQMVAEPFQPPAARVRALAATLTISGDSLWWRGARIELPASRITGEGAYTFASRRMRLRLRAAPIALADMRWLYPRLPAQGGGSFDLELNLGGSQGVRAAVQNAGLSVGDATLTGDVELTAGGGVELQRTAIRFAGLDTRLIEQLVPSLHLPGRGVLSGRARATGTSRALHVDGDVTFDGIRSGASHVVAAGELGFHDGVRARSLRLHFSPLQLGLVRGALGIRGLGGTLNGRVTVSGSGATGWRVRGDVTHHDRGARSHLIGRIALGARSTVDIDVRASPVSLTTLGRLTSRRGLRGAAAGTIRASGQLRDLTVWTEMRVLGGGALAARGRVDLASALKGYDLTVASERLDLQAVLARAPRTSLSAVASARGRGVTAESMRATLAAHLRASWLSAGRRSSGQAGSRDRGRRDSVSVDTAEARLVIAGGVVHVDTLAARTSYADASVSGAIGIVSGRRGELRYRARIDSLAGLARWIPADSGVVTPRPARLARAIARARSDSLRLAKATEVERLATGAPAPTLVVDTVRPVRRDSLSGSLDAAGTLRGSIARFDLRGRTTVSRVVVRGTVVDSGTVSYALMDARAPRSRLLVNASLDSVAVQGFAFDRLGARLHAQGSRGRVALAIRQDERRAFRARADIEQRPGATALRLTELMLRFDTTRWVAVGPSTISWGRHGLSVNTFRMQSGAGGSVRVDGSLAADSTARMALAAEGVRAEHVMALLQGDTRVAGVMSLAARVEGTPARPRFRGTGRLAGASYRGRAAPDLRATFAYADSGLEVRAALARRAGKPLLVAEGRLPVTLTPMEVSRSRVVRDAQVALTIRGDSIPLELVPQFTGVLDSLHGRAAVAIALRGTPRRPTITGRVSVDRASATVVPAEVTLRDITGTLRIIGDTATLDSLVARSDGWIRARGSVHLATLVRPIVALEATAENVRLLGGRQANLHADAELAADGPLDDVRIAGRVNVRKGYIELPGPKENELRVFGAGSPEVFAILDTTALLNRARGLTQLPLEPNLRADITLHLSPGTYYRSPPDASIEVFSREDLRIRYDRRAKLLTIVGVNEAGRGDYVFWARRLRLERGSTTFAGARGVDLVQATGEHDVWLPGREALQMRVLISGTTVNPRFAVESSRYPPIPSTDLLSYLSFGRSPTSLLQQAGSSLSGPSTSSGYLAGAVGALARRQLASTALGVTVNQLGYGLADAIYADAFSITPTDVPMELWASAVGGIQGTTVTVGRYLGLNTLVTAEIRPMSALPGIRLEHRLSRTWGVDASFGPRFLLREPSLSMDQEAAMTGVFGTFLLGDWSF